MLDDVEPAITEHKQQKNAIRIKFNVILRLYLVIKVKANWSELKLRK